ncbi:MAG: replication initiator protein A [Firmicutes bacterium]|nr:replication initiator protein A [Bacillota bacterium]MCL2311732.1 replication initiator protein A [Bacillota bacterium]
MKKNNVKNENKTTTENFDYFYANENEQYLFLQMPLMLIKDNRFKWVSGDGKILYSVALNRTALSARNGWLDENGRVYIIYTIKEIMEDLNCWNEKANKLLKELRDVGLIKIVRQGLTKPNLIYVMNFATELKYRKPEREEKPSEEEAEKNAEERREEKDEKEGERAESTMTYENRSSGNLKTENQHIRKSNTSNINQSKNEINQERVSIYQGQSENEKTEEQPTMENDNDTIDINNIDNILKSDNIEEVIADNISLDELVEEHSDKKDKITELYNIVCEVLSNNKSPTIRINKQPVPINSVKYNFAQLNKSHILYVLHCLEKNAYNITTNSKAYITTSLFHSIRTIGYYQSYNNSAFRSDEPQQNQSSFDINKFFERAVKKSYINLDDTDTPAFASV